MAKKPERNYIVEALSNQYHLIFLVFMAALAVVTWSWLPLVGIAGFEMIYLATVPGSKAFQRSVEHKYRAIASEDEKDALKNRIADLPFDQQRRVEQVAGIVDSIRGNLKDDKEGLLEGVGSQLKPFIDRYVSLCEARNSYRQLMDSVSEEELRRDLSKVDKELRNASERVKRTLTERKGVINRRMERLKNVRDNESVIGHQLDTIEDTLKLIQESTMTVGNPEGISSQIDGLLNEVEIAEEAVLDAESSTSSEHHLEHFDQALAD